MKLDQLAYVVIRSAKVDDWRQFASMVLGTMVEDGPDGSLYLKYDEWHYRVLIVPAADDAFVASGWSLRSRSAYAAFRDHVESKGVTVQESTPAERELRKVHEFFSFTDPSGSRHEVCWGRTMSATPFVSPVGVSRFVTGELGMGHVVLPNRDADFDEGIRFYEEVMGLEYSDYVARAAAPGAPPLRAYFFHCANARQHSLALMQIPEPTGLIHFLVEVGTLDDVGRALERAQQSGTPIIRSLGRHVNDSIVSFYLLSPSGIHIEYGFGGELMDWSNHEVRNVSYGTYWGHAWQLGFEPGIPSGK